MLSVSQNENLVRPISDNELNLAVKKLKARRFPGGTNA